MKTKVSTSVISEIKYVATLPPDDRVESTTVHPAWTTLLGLRHEWEDLLASTKDSTIFSTMEWLQSWWSAFANHAELQCLSFCMRDELIGIAPLFRSGTSILGRQLKRLALVGAGSGDSDNLDFITRPGYEQRCVSAFLDWLDQNTDWDLCCLETLPEDSRIVAILSRRLSELHWPFRTMTIPRSYLALPNSWDEYLKNLAPDFRPLLTRYPKRLEARYRCQTVRCETQEHLNHYLPILFELHQQRWRENGQPGVFVDPKRRCFYEHMAKAFLEKGWLEFWILELDGAPKAAQFCFHYRDTVYLLQEGFDPQYADQKVGYALRAKMLRHFIECGVKRYDFLGGADAYKRKFGAELGSYVTLRFAKPRSLGELYLRLEHSSECVRRRLRASLPQSVLTVIRAIRGS